MAVKFFPARIHGNCALCGKAYAALEMVAFYPGSQISHYKCALHPEQVIRAAAPTLRVIKGERFDAFKEKISARLPEGMQPRGFQLEGVYAIQRFNNRALVGDDQGLGKTIEALIWLAVNRRVRPVVIVVPSSVKLNWRKEIKRWLPRRRSNKVYILNGRKPVELPEAGIFVINYDIVKYWLSALLKIKPQAVICDEAQYLKNPKAQRTIAVLGSGKRGDESPFLCAGVDNRLFLSGTPATNRPAELWPVIHNLRPDVFPSFWQYAHRYCAAYQSKFGLNISGASNIVELSQKLRETCMIRREKSEVLKELPAKQRATIPLEIHNRAEYDFAHKDLIAWMLSEGQDVSGARKAEALVKIEKLKQIAVRGKLDAAMEWVHNFLAGTEKLVLFVHHRDIADKVIEELKPYGVVKITGDSSDRERQAAVDAFQTDAKVRVIVCSLRAASLGITLTASQTVAFLELGWTPGEHNQAEDRIHRIGQLNACTAYYLLANKTIEEKIAKLIDAKRAILTGILDGRETAENEGILGSLITDLSGGE